jgi:hypothetical protein
VKIRFDRLGEPVEQPPLVSTWEADSRGNVPYAVVEAVDPEGVKIDPLTYM